MVTYDKLGRVVTCAAFGADDRPIVNAFGYAKAILQRDEDQGNISEVDFEGTDGQPMAMNGVARVQIKHDGRGNEIGKDFFGVDARPSANNDGYARFTANFDDRGNQIDLAFFGVDNQPVLSNQDSRAPRDEVRRTG